MPNQTKENRPWGWFETIEEGIKYKFKRLWIAPNKRFSLQKHNKRSEIWIVYQGSGVVTLNDKTIEVTVGSSVNIAVGDIHRATAGDDGLLIFEAQFGECQEEDIVRFEDDFGRA